MDRAALENMVKDLGVRYKTHDSHGFYIEFWVGETWFMFDPTPDTQYENGRPVKVYPKGMILVRDETHRPSAPTQLAEFDNDLDGLLTFLEKLVLRESQSTEKKTGCKCPMLRGGGIDHLAGCSKT